MRPDQFRERTRRYIEENRLLEPQQKTLVACSGGPDSMALLHVLFTLGWPVEAAHVNYLLRGADSDADEALVRSWCADRRLSVHALRQSPKDLARAQKLSLQVAARRIRYAYFEQLLKQLDIRQAATAHQRGDQAETLFLHLMRGKNFAILRGIPAKRGPFARPLLFASRKEILEYLHAEDVPYRIDASNETGDYLRNHVRNVVFPALERLNPSYEEQLCERLELYRRQTSLLNDLLARQGAGLAQLTPDGISFDADACDVFHLETQLLLLLERNWNLRPTEAEQVTRLLTARPGARVRTRQGVFWRTSEGIQRVPLDADNDKPAEAAIDLQALPQPLRLGQGWLLLDWVKAPLALPLSGNEQHIDADALRGELTLRPWRAGERWQPLGLKGTRLISDELTDAKYPALLRKSARVLADVEGPVWLETGRIAHRVRLTETTVRALRIRRVAEDSDIRGFDSANEIDDSKS